ncbi:uroporphyrinogen-III C-methyltransferase [Hymenobacter sp. B1770]|uniref:uroporphyrinogen-III C-methyltransferase n=1 Tax=Hymenobacter sp. B1770 TaxID=1718788 RepID=UPI003CE979D3
MADIIPELYVVGAGPGDPDLLTLKAFKVLQTAAVVLYDNLANEALLKMTPLSCECIYVGKKPYGDYTPQEVIHALILEKAFTRGRVVRLKGGDPYVFGRGFEEILFARANGIATHYVPGISSMQGLGFEDIPLTHRLVSEGIWMLTGTKKDGSLTADLRLAMQSNSTVVIYMGLKKAPEIAAAYRNMGQGDTPAAIVQHLTLPQQKVAVGQVQHLPELVASQGITYPALIVIGEVVALAHNVPATAGPPDYARALATRP